MRGAGAARRREQDQEPPPDGASVEAALRRVIAGSEAVQRRLGRHERAIASEVGRMAQLAAVCPDAERLAVAADGLAARYALVAVELISDAAHNAEAREACEAYAQTAAFTEAMRAAAFEAGRQAGIAEEQARASRAPRGRPAHRKSHLRVAGGAAVKATAVAAAAATATTMIASHDSASVRHWASSSPAAVRVHAGRPDTAVPFPSPPPRAYVPKHARPSADAASASPAPPSPPPVFTPAPQPPPPAPSPSPHVDFNGELDVQTATCVIGSAGGCVITFSAVGGWVSWSAQASSPDLVLSAGSGTLVDGHPGAVVVTVRAGALAGTGTVTITDGKGNATQVQVSWVAVPGLPV